MQPDRVVERLRARLAESGPPGSPDPDARHRATDASGLVQVVLEGRGRCVDVEVGSTWRAVLTQDGLGPAVVDGLTAAATVRLTVWAAWAGPPVQNAGSEGPAVAASLPPLTQPPMTQPPMTLPPVTLPPVTRRTADLLSRAWADVTEFRVRLGELHAAETTVRTRHVTVTALGGRIVRVEPDRWWLDGVSRTELGAHLAAAVNSALDQLADIPSQALAGCPDLRELLADPPIPTRLQQEA